MHSQHLTGSAIGIETMAVDVIVLEVSFVFFVFETEASVDVVSVVADLISVIVVVLIAVLVVVLVVVLVAVVLIVVVI